MTEMVYQALKEQLARPRIRTDFGFPNGRGGPLDQHNISRRNWHRILAKAEVAPRAIYRCRHTFAVVMIERGVNLHWVAHQLGHRSLQMLIRHYARWMSGKTARPERDVIADAIRTEG